MNYAEGFRRVFKVIGILAALAALGIGVLDRPTREQIEYSTQDRLLTSLGKSQALRDGLDRPWPGYDIKDAQYRDWSNRAIIEANCGRTRPKQGPEISDICSEHRQRIDGLGVATALHLGRYAVGAALAYFASVWLCMLLTWIGRGFADRSIDSPR